MHQESVFCLVDMSLYLGSPVSSDGLRVLFERLLEVINSDILTLRAGTKKSESVSKY